MKQIINNLNKARKIKKILDIALFVLVVWLIFGAYLNGIDYGKKEQQKTIELEVYKRCLDSDIYNEFECYNMIIKGE